MSLYAVCLGTPYFTAASAYPSMNISTNAGPQPVTAPPIPISDDGSSSTIPTAANRSFICSLSSFSREFWASKSITPSYTMAGVFGMTNCTLTELSKYSLYFLKSHPAATDISAFP